MVVLGKRNSDKCGNGGVKENIEHIILPCTMYELERERLHDKAQEAGQEWDLMGLLGT